jgi:hypothetical protein
MSTNTIFGTGNIISDAATNSLAEGQNNRILAGNANHVEGVGNTIVMGEANHAEGSMNTILSGENNHIEGENSRLAGFQNHVQGSNHDGDGFQSNHVGDGHTTVATRAGQNISGFNGHFLYDPSKTFATDIYNYSNQFAGGNATSQFPGEGIGIIQKTLLNGIYPIAQHQAYRNTSDGLSYSVMLKGIRGLHPGTFVTFGKGRDKLIIPAKSGKKVIGVITESSGFIANAGQFAASERIQYDVYRTPLVKLNCVPVTDTDVRSKYQPKEELVSNDQQCPPGSTLRFPAFQTEPLSNVDRSVPFVPFTERENYYQVALLGLVVVNLDYCEDIGDMCDVKYGVAVEGCKYWVVKKIDNKRALILLK